MPLELNVNGLQTQTFSEIKEAALQEALNSFGSTFDISEGTFYNKEASILSEREFLLQEALFAIYLSRYRSTASGSSLDYNLEYTGITRQVATASIVSVAIKGTSGTNVVAGELLARIPNALNTFENRDAITLAAYTEYSVDSITRAGTTATATISGGHIYANDDYVFVEGANETGYNLLAQIRNVTGTTFDYTVDGAIPASATGTLISNYGNQVTFIAQETGPLDVLTGQLTEIIGSVSGVDKIENYEDAIVGANTETDAEVRKRANDSISISGGGFREAIVSRVLNVTGVTFVQVFENTTFSVDVNGRPPKSIEVFVEGGDDTDIAVALFNAYSAGIETYGTESIIVQDSQGEDVTVKFSRLQVVDIYVVVDITTNSDVNQGPVFPVTGDDDIKTALSEVEFQAGFDVWETTLRNAVFSVPGIITAIVKFDKTPAPTNTGTVVIADVEVAQIDSADVTVNHV